MNQSISYRDAGVDINAGNEVVTRIKDDVKRTYQPAVLGELGGFGGLYDLTDICQNYQQPIMAQSIDGVGTKTIVARMADCFEYLGSDLLSACSNDILVLGAKTLTMLDYIANDQLVPSVVARFIKGLSNACVAQGVSLIGGETAEMPDTYRPGEHDLVGIVTGVVEKSNIIDGTTIQAQDILIGFNSSGLHTNGFSLARKLLFDVAGFTIHQRIDELQSTIAEALLEPHINYAKPIHALLNQGITIRGIAHITGGGLLENIPRILPDHMSVEIKTSSWQTPALFKLLTELGHLPAQEQYRTFNMGIGLVMIIPEQELPQIDTVLSDFPEFGYQRIGEVITGEREVHLI